MTTKDGNPKQAEGVKKVQFHVIPAPVLAEVAVALTEGAMKYGSYNWRVKGVRSSTYYDACLRHLTSYWEGEDIDPDSGLPHLVKAITSLIVLRDSQVTGNHTDDRPPHVKADYWQKWLNIKTEDLIKKYPEPKAPYTHK